MLRITDLNSKSELKYFFLPIITILVFLTHYGLYLARNVSTESHFTIKSSMLINKPAKEYLILLWTPYFSQYSNWPKYEDLNCKYKNCKLTSNRRLLQSSDALLIHWRDIRVNDLPKHHREKQAWIILNQESPHNTPYNEIIPLINQINWTMTYRRDSDIFAPYGEIVKCNDSKWKPVYDFSKKVKSVAWIVSNCHTHSKREKYVKKLQNYIDVDIYGGCGTHNCQRHPSCFDIIARDYKFYLSFENSICKDYVTEKLFNATRYDIIPIVLGGANYSSLMPPKSYIDIFNYSSPKELASYLHSVASDRVIYNSYLTWKQSYCAYTYEWEFFCNMCDKLNNPHYKVKNTKLTDWWFSEGNCKIGAQY